MKKIRFHKYQATGNDFVVADNRDGGLTFTDEEVQRVCDRRFGIGADGIILLEKDAAHDFRMSYRNRDGSEGFCGNGCRAIVHFARELGVAGAKSSFSAFDGSHEAEIFSDGTIQITLQDVNRIDQKSEEDFYAHTGTDHNVRFVRNLGAYPVVEEGKRIRYSDRYKPRGTNADVVEILPGNRVSFRIYERGVEDETFSSGSGATACALVAAKVLDLPSPVQLTAPGGELTVAFSRDNGAFRNVSFRGPVQKVFETDFIF